MQYTDNINLKKPDGIDPASITDINNNSDIIDQIINSITTVLNGDYLVTPYTISGETIKIFKIQSKTSNEYTIAEIRAPETNSKEATLALMLPQGDINGNSYFVDFSMLTYEDIPRATIVLQTRGGILYPLHITTSDGDQIKNLVSFNPDGTFELKKDLSTDNRKIKLGGYGVIQDRLHWNNEEYAGYRRTCIMFNCYYSTQHEDEYTRISNWVDCYKMEFDGTDSTGGITFYRIPAGEGVFYGADWVQIGKIDATGIYEGQNTLESKYYQNNNIIDASITYDPPSLTTTTSITTTLDVMGVNIGDFVIASFSNVLQGINLFAEVTAQDIVTVTFSNQTGNTIDLNSGILRVKVFKA